MRVKYRLFQTTTKGKHTDDNAPFYPRPPKPQGYWKAGAIEGKGVFDYAQGDKYRGEFKESRKHGKGVYAWANGDRCHRNAVNIWYFFRFIYCLCVRSFGYIPRNLPNLDENPSNLG